MNTFLKKAMFCLLAIFLMSGQMLLKADCTFSNLTLDQVVQNNDGSYDITMTFCATGGYDGCTDITGAFGFFLEGGAKVVGHPSTMTSPQTGETFVGLIMSYASTSDVVVFHDNGQYIWWTCVDSNCGPSVPVCSSITITTDILPTKIICGGMEGQGVLVAPYSCTGANLEVFPDPNFPPPSCYTFDLIANVGSDVDVLYSYQGSECTNISVTTTGSGTPPYNYLWSNGSSSNTISVCPSVNTNYSVTITDAEGCVTSDDMNVNVQDIFCANNKVYMCKPNGTLTRCVRLNRVQQKLNNGWTLGPCGNSNIEIDDSIIELLVASDQEEIEERTKAVQEVEIYVYNIMGELLSKIKGVGNLNVYASNIMNDFTIPNGIYIMVKVNKDGSIESRKFYK